MDTNMGVMTLELLEDIAPLTTANLIRLAEQGYYDGLIFHRVIDGFMIQGGDPNGNGTGGPGYNIVDEFPVDDQGNLLVTHDTLGVLSMANAGPGTGGSQFFITLNQTGWLDGLHTVFGRIISGTTVLQAIGGVATDAQDRPTSDVVINTITITDVP
ncbi:MAG: peptidylprolyl isomerase [Gammaproteobacteria bacterium]|nr:peptidylprolyl isomerase [Gammaproteobacteria bacterium]